ncbi:hypothetical protein ES332_D05G017200v1 [Gossypium tomentosum]|uniref:Uncharacterized protein n=1 Tax=Gossypium tomentosum TaxID=34277 RepID=A0A5D2KNW9_GOSTO|nr:hypothetical protein ES332_D05G017200v1 [Gossypium tomentosum]
MLVRFNPKTDLRIDSVVKYDLRLSRANITFHIPSILLPSSSSCCSFLVTVHIYVCISWIQYLFILNFCLVFFQFIVELMRHSRYVVVLFCGYFARMIIRLWCKPLQTSFVDFL